MIAPRIVVASLLSISSVAAYPEDFEVFANGTTAATDTFLASPSLSADQTQSYWSTFESPPCGSGGGRAWPGALKRRTLSVEADGGLTIRQAAPAFGSVIGALLHSRPLVIDYGGASFDRPDGEEDSFTPDYPARFIAVGSSDGFLRLIRDRTPDGQVDGSETWAFMPPEVIPEQEQYLADAVSPPSGYQHLQGVDGSPTALIIDRNGDGTFSADAGDRVLLFIGLRRGGRAYYAFDISNPYSPRFLWKVSNHGRTEAGAATATDTSDYLELGLSFSMPRVALLDERSPVLIFGGGYDGGPPVAKGAVLERPGKDRRGLAQASSTGNAIFVLDAQTGELVWKAVRGSATGPSTDPRLYEHEGLIDAIPSTVALLDSDGNGRHDRVLVGDTGGNLWRADLGPKRGDWKLVRLACLGRSGGDGCSSLHAKSNDRRFFHAPDIVQHRSDGQRYDVVIIGSGDRANPLDRSADTADADLEETRDGSITHNRVYALRDDNVAIGTATELELEHGDLSNITDCIADDCRVGRNGWYLSLEQTGEKVLSTPLTAAGTVTFTSYVPPAAGAGACEAGTGRLYALDLTNGSPSPLAGTAGDSRATALTSDGIPPDVTVVGVGPPTEAGACRLLLLAGERSITLPACTRFRTSWHRPG